MEYAIKCEGTNEGTYSTFVPSFVRSVSRIEKNSLHCPDSHVTYSARDVVARVVRPQGIGIAASRDAARTRGRGRGRCRSRRRGRRGVASFEMGRAARRSASETGDCQMYGKINTVIILGVRNVRRY